MSRRQQTGFLPDASASPAFGQADLFNCEREQIHLAGSIQPHGALLLVREPDLRVVQSSANAASFLNITLDILGLRLRDLAGDLAEQIRPHLGDPLHLIPVAVRCHIGMPERAYDCLLHRPQGGGLVLELERAGGPVDLQEHVEQALQRIVSAMSLQDVCDETAKILKALTGYDRVMVYRFDDLGHGEVFAEQARPELESFLGNRYPASDIPEVARRLYMQNRVRVLFDVEYEPVPLTPRLSPLTGEDLDMSHCVLRSMSPIHIQYLKNMGVAATLVVSLVVGGRLWGLIACHHGAPRFIHYEMRTICDLVAESVATRISALESFNRSQAQIAVRRLEQRVVQAVSRDGDWRSALFDSSKALLQPLRADGAALLFEGEVLTVGEVPGTPELRDIGMWLDTQPRQQVLATACLGTDNPVFAPITEAASGLVATPVSAAPGDYLLWFRSERVRTVTWGGNPFKPVQIGNDPMDLSPRRSFTKWHQLVEGTSEPWTPADLAAARLISETVADVIMQVRSVRMLIAQDQLDRVRRQVRGSDQPVIIADAQGTVLLTNAALESLLGPPPLRGIDDLAALVGDPAALRRGLSDLIRHRRAWRGEALLDTGRGEPRALLIRADPVFAPSGRVLGFVILFTDLTERKLADAARRRFQEGLFERNDVMPARLDAHADLVYRNLFSSMIGNAQLAALEITDGAEVGEMPDMLESVRSSINRTSDLLEQLILHASRTKDAED